MSFMPTAAAHGNHLGPFVSIGVRASPTCILIALVRCGALFPRAASAGKALLYTIPSCGRSFPGHFFSSLSRPVSYSSFLIPFPREISTNEQKTRSGRSRFPLPRGGESPEARAGSPGPQWGGGDRIRKNNKFKQRHEKERNRNTEWVEAKEKNTLEIRRTKPNHSVC